MFTPDAWRQDPPLQPLYAPRTTKLALMSLTTVGLYVLYWGYKNWSIMRASGRTAAWPPICGFFLPLTLFSLVIKLRRDAERIGIRPFPLMGWALAFLLLGLLKLIPVVGFFFSTISFLILIPINKAFHAINVAHHPPQAHYENFTLPNIIWFAIVIASLVGVAWLRL